GGESLLLNNIDIQERMNHYNVHGISIAMIEDSQISWTKNYGFLEADSDRTVSDRSIFNACSVSKFLTGMSAMKLVENGMLDLDQNVNEKLIMWEVPENEYTKNKKVTLRHLLSHQSGIKDPEDSFAELNPKMGVPSMVELLEGKSPYCTVPIEAQCEPGNNFHYSDAGFCVMQQLMEDVMGKPFYQVASEFIFTPLGMDNSHLNMTPTEMKEKE